MSNRKYLAEFVGTAILVIVGCGSAVMAGYGAGGAAGLSAISLAFGFIVGGPVSIAKLRLIGRKVTSISASGYFASPPPG